VRLYTHVLLAICTVLFCLALAGLTTDIVMRYAFSSSVRGMQEIVNLLFTWIFLLGIAALYARKGDASISFAVKALPPKAQILMNLLVALIIMTSAGILCVEAISLVQEQAGIMSAELRIPEPFRLAPLAIASASITLTSLIDAWSCVIWFAGGQRPLVWRDGAAGEHALPQEL
jgi:TRAP-type C4-dicarboxylate transport system permease small subunit